MKFTHKPLKIEAEKFKQGMEDGLIAPKGSVRDWHDIVFFPNPEDKNVTINDRISQSRFAGRTTELLPAILVDGKPVQVNEGDWIVTHANGSRTVMTDDTLQSLYEADNGEQDEEAETTGREHQEEDNEGQGGRVVRRGRPPNTTVTKPQP